MKTSFSLRSIMAALGIGMSCLVISCDNDNDNDNMYTISGNASGAQETPPVTTAATGTLTGSYNKDNNQFNYTINWTGLSGNVSASHFHGPAAVGVAAPPIIPFTVTVNGTSGSYSNTVTLEDSTENYLLDGKLYYNLHTVLNPAGEIRGQVTATRN